MALPVAGCPLCDEAGGRLVFQGAKLRVIHAAETGFPAFYRVVWSDHVAEWSDLAPEDRALCMEAVAVVEQCLRDALSPAKINLAALGNMVPHLHWHVIARFDWDSHFPQPIWGLRQREVEGGAQAQLACSLAELDAAVKAAVLAAENAPPG